MTASETGRRGRGRLLALAAVALIAAAAVVVAILVAGGDDEDDERAAPPAAAAAPPGVQRFQSRPDLHPPVVTVDRAPGDPGDRLILVSPRMEVPKRDGATHQQGALAVDESGRTVWFSPAPRGEPTTDVRVQRYDGEPVMTYWQGAASKLGVGRGEAVILDQSYREVATVQAGNGLSADLHEFRLTPRGTALLTIYSRARADLTPLGGEKRDLVTEGVVQEVDVESGEVLFEWHSLDEIDPASETVRPLPERPEDSFDYFHINSVAEDTDGNLLVSARHTSAVYKINRETGKLIWRLGGKKSDFEMGPGTEFGLQHDVQRVAGGHIRVFDNGDEVKEGRQPASSVKTLRLDMDRMRATLVEEIEQPDGMWAESQGNAFTAPGGGTIVGWGSTGAFSWFDGDGRLRFDAHLPAYYDSYRAYAARWTGRPAAPPALRARREAAQVTAWASWNGSTEVRSWQLLAGSAPDDLKPVGRPAPWNGLETTLVRQTAAPLVAVAALDEDGERLRRSAAVRVGPVPPRPAP